MQISENICHLKILSIQNFGPTVYVGVYCDCSYAQHGSKRATKSKCFYLLHTQSCVVGTVIRQRATGRSWMRALSRIMVGVANRTSCSSSSCSLPLSLSPSLSLPLSPSLSLPLSLPLSLFLSLSPSLSPSLPPSLHIGCSIIPRLYYVPEEELLADETGTLVSLATTRDYSYKLVPFAEEVPFLWAQAIYFIAKMLSECRGMC